MDCSPPGSSVDGDSPGKDTGVGSHALLQGIFPTQGSNPCLFVSWGFFTTNAIWEAPIFMNSTNFPLHFSWKFRPGSEIMVLIEEKFNLWYLRELGICGQCDQQSSRCQSRKWSLCPVLLLADDATFYPLHWELTCGQCTSVLPHLQVQVWVKTSLLIFQGGDAATALLWKSRNREMSEQL